MLCLLRRQSKSRLKNVRLGNSRVSDHIQKEGELHRKEIQDQKVKMEALEEKNRELEKDNANIRKRLGKGAKE